MRSSAAGPSLPPSSPGRSREFSPMHDFGAAACSLPALTVVPLDDCSFLGQGAHCSSFRFPTRGLMQSNSTASPQLLHMLAPAPPHKLGPPRQCAGASAGNAPKLQIATSVSINVLLVAALHRDAAAVAACRATSPATSLASSAGAAAAARPWRLAPTPCTIARSCCWLVNGVEHLPPTAELSLQRFAVEGVRVMLRRMWSLRWESSCITVLGKLCLALTPKSSLV